MSLEPEFFDFEKTLLNLKARYVGDKRFADGFCIGQMMYRIGLMLQSKLPLPEATNTPPPPVVSSEKVAIESSAVLSALARTHRRIQIRNRPDVAGFPIPKQRKDQVVAFLTSELLSSSQVVAQVRQVFNVPFVKTKDGTDRLIKLVQGDIYLLKKSGCLEQTGEGKESKYRFISGSTPGWKA